MSNKYERMWELNSLMIGLRGRIERRKQLIERHAHDSASLADLNVKAERKLELARAEHSYWNRAYVLEYHSLVMEGVSWVPAEMDAVVVELALLRVENVSLDNLEDPEYVAAARAGMRVYKTALLSRQAILERRLA